jgi:hypothetical protein
VKSLSRSQPRRKHVGHFGWIWRLTSAESVSTSTRLKHRPRSRSDLWGTSSGERECPVSERMVGRGVLSARSYIANVAGVGAPPGRRIGELVGLPGGDARGMNLDVAHSWALMPSRGRRSRTLWYLRPNYSRAIRGATSIAVRSDELCVLNRHELYDWRHTGVGDGIGYPRLRGSRRSIRKVREAS